MMCVGKTIFYIFRAFIGALDALEVFSIVFFRLVTFETLETCGAVKQTEGDDDSNRQEFHVVLSAPRIEPEYNAGFTWSNNRGVGYL